MAKEIDLADRFMNMGAQLVKQVAVRTNEVAGDGTTTATVLAQAMLHDGVRVIAAGSNPMALRRGMEQGVRVALGGLLAMATPVEGKDTVGHIPAIAGHDPRHGALIADLLRKVGTEGGVHGVDVPGAVWERAVGQPAGRAAQVGADQPSDIHAEASQGRLQLLTRPGGVGGFVLAHQGYPPVAPALRSHGPSDGLT